MSALSDTVKIYVQAEDKTVALESSARDLEAQIATARAERDIAKRVMEKTFMDSGDKAICVPVDTGTVVTFLRRGDSYCQVDITPLDSDAEFVAVQKTAVKAPAV